MFLANKNSFLVKTYGFTLIELLLVVLLIGILCHAGFSTYSNITSDTTINTLSDEINAFFASCRDNAKIRHKTLNIVYNKQVLNVVEEPNIYLPITNAKELQLPNNIYFSKNGEFIVNGIKTSKLNCSICLNNGKLASITIDI